MKAVIAAIWILWSVPSVPAAHAAGDGTELRQDCYRANEGGQRYTYCVHSVTPSVNADVVYYLHGANGDAESWANGDHFREMYDTWGTQAPTVVSVSYGPHWLLAERNPSRYSGLLTHFVQTVIPSIERERALKPARRHLAGASMGGFNASQLYLKNPELFSKVALLCPALAEIGPFSGDAAIDAYVARTGANRGMLDNSLYLTRLFFPNRAAWASADPLPVAQARVKAGYPDLLVTIGLQDDYGFFEGSSKFVDAVKAKGAKATYVSVQGKHCSWDWKSVIQFLVEP